MMINGNYNLLQPSYLFTDIAKRTRSYLEQNPGRTLIRMGIGDVTLPLVPAVTDAMHKAVDEMGQKETFRGYGPEQGYDFLRNAIVKYYSGFGVTLQPDEIFISDGAKSDVANITGIFSNDNTILVSDPVYTVYADSNLMLGRKIVYADATRENGFLPMPEDAPGADIIYICSPNNPTGAAYDRKQLKAWVEYALKRGSVILYDAAYEAFVTSEDKPRSIFEIEGAKECAIEFCSLSKTAGFTGTRCGYTVIPHALERDGMKLNKMWLRRQTTEFNGTSYIVQRGAEAVFTDEGIKQVRQNIAAYQQNARVIAKTMQEAGVFFTGGVHSPYIWFKCPTEDSWSFFDAMLREQNIVGTPGAGFGKNGEGFMRLTAFNTLENTIEAMERLKKLL